VLLKRGTGDGAGGQKAHCLDKFNAMFGGTPDTLLMTHHSLSSAGPPPRYYYDPAKIVLY
jgi:hypothetical protein